MTEHALLRSLVREMLEMSLRRPESGDWLLFGIGLLRGSTPDGRHLHVFDPNFKTPGVTEVHNHLQGFVSNIVEGSLRQNIYTHARADVPGGRPIRLGMKLMPHGPESSIELWEYVQPPRLPGTYYVMMPEFIHKAIPERGTVTVVKMNTSAVLPDDTPHAHYFDESIGYVPVSAVHPKARELREIIEYSLETWFR